MNVGSLLIKSRVYPIFGSENLYHNTLDYLIEAVAKAGVEIIQLREKNLSTSEFLSHAKRYVPLAKRLGITCIINDNIEVSLKSDADGLHIGQSDISPREARKLIGPNKILGLSLDTPQDLESAISQPIDHISLTAFNSTTKQVTNTYGSEGLKLIRSKTALPLVAIGGINETNISAIAKHCDCVAVSRVICESPDPYKTTLNLRLLFNNNQ